MKAYKDMSREELLTSEEMADATKIFVLCVKLVSVEKILSE